MLNKVKFLSVIFFIFLGCGDSPSVIYVAPYEGCMDPVACNYDDGANADDGSCEYISCIIYGCTEPSACNYDPNASIENDTCYSSFNELSVSLDFNQEAVTAEGFCALPENTVYITSNGKVLYNISEEIAGFQFEIVGATVLSVFGGDASEAGFFLSGTSTILGVSFTGATIPAGCGTLFELSLLGDLEDVNLIISNISGAEINASYISGCDCEFSSSLDCSGICGGDDDSCFDCAGVPNGDSVLDCAEICDGNSIVCEAGDVCVGEATCNDLLAIQSIIDANNSTMADEDPYNLADWNDEGRAYRLKLSDKGITTIPSDIDDLTELTQLFLSYNNIVFLNYNIGNLARLEHLYLSFNDIENLPPTIANLENLIVLDIEGNSLTDLPNEVVNLSNLETLNIGLNSLSALPNLTTLNNLVTLYANHNLLESIPPSITSLASLSILNLDSNQLTELPSGLCDMSTLSSLSISNNQICDELSSSCSEITIIGESNQNCED